MKIDPNKQYRYTLGDKTHIIKGSDLIEDKPKIKVWINVWEDIQDQEPRADVSFNYADSQEDIDLTDYTIWKLIARKVIEIEQGEGL